MWGLRFRVLGFRGRNSSDSSYSVLLVLLTSENMTAVNNSIYNTNRNNTNSNDNSTNNHGNSNT